MVSHCAVWCEHVSCQVSHQNGRNPFDPEKGVQKGNNSSFRHENEAIKGRNITNGAVEVVLRLVELIEEGM